MAFLDKIKGSSKSKEEKNKKGSLEPKEIDISNAQTIYLPKLKFEPPADTVKQNWDEYYSITQKAQSHYKRKWYQKAKEEWLKIYNWHHRDHMYLTYLLRTYRKLIDAAINKNKYNEALTHFNDLFEKCSNFTNIDIKKYNKVATHFNKISKSTELPLKESIANDEPDFKIDSDMVAFIQETKKPRGFKFEYSGATSILDLKSKSDFLPLSIPHIEFDNTRISYKGAATIQSIPNNTYRFRESSYLNAFLSSSIELKIYYYNWNLDLMGSFDASTYAGEHTHLRRIELSSDLSHFLFTIVDEAYLLDSEMNLISVWQVPHKDGFEKRKLGESSGINEEVKDYLKVLELYDKPTIEEIKSAFRKLVIKWHPDKNPNNPLAEEKTKQLIQAYEFLSGESAQEVFDGFESEDYYWVDLSHITTFEVDGMTVEMNLSIGSGEDWIYGAGMSFDSSRIYLGCYSGKVYQVNKEGIAEKIFIVPEDEKGEYGPTNPISFVTEYNNRKYILTSHYLYILKEDKIRQYLENETGNFRWFTDGFIHQGNKVITFYNIDGDNKGTLSFNSPIKQVCYCADILLIETTTKAYTFKITQ